MVSGTPAQRIEQWPIDKLIFYARNPRKNDAAVDRMCSSIREFGLKIPVLARSDGEVVDGHLRLKAARKLGSWPGGDTTQIPVVLCDEWTPQQVKAFRLMVNRSVAWADWDEELLALELQGLNAADFDLSLTGFNPGEIDGLLAIPDEERANEAPPIPENPVSRAGDLWLCGEHRVLCGDALRVEDVARLLGDREPILMVTDPPYGIELDSEWRDRAGLNTAPGEKRTPFSKAAAKRHPSAPAEPSYMKHRTEGHTETTISGDTRADWSEAFELVPSLQIAYVWHAFEIHAGSSEWAVAHVVRQGRRKLHHLGITFPEVHHGRFRRAEVRSPHAEACRADAAPDPEPSQARRAGLRAVSGIGDDPGRRGTHRSACAAASSWTRSTST